MSAASRHTACKFCRERKVRCDGGQPSCEKCRLAGEECVYVPMQKPTKADLTQTMEVLQKRLERNSIPRQSYSPPDWQRSAEYSRTSVPFHFQAPSFLGDTGPISTRLSVSHPFGQMSDSIDKSPASQHPCSCLDWQKPTDYSRAPASFQFQVPTFLGDAGSVFNQSSLSSHHHQHGQQHASEPFDDRVLRGVVPNDRRNTGGLSDPLHFLDEEMGNYDGSDGDPSSRVRGPAQREIDMSSSGFGELGNASSSDTAVSSNLSPSDTMSTNSKLHEDTASTIFTHLSTFLSTIFHSQAEISGIALVVAEYLAWMRKVPARAVPPDTNLVNMSMLETVESRLRELRTIAQTRHHTAFREMMVALEGAGPLGNGAASNMRELEKELQKGTDDLSQFFQTRYSACSMLSEQVQNMPEGLSGARGKASGQTALP